jgi:hypothetical protein
LLQPYFDVVAIAVAVSDVTFCRCPAPSRCHRYRLVGCWIVCTADAMLSASYSPSSSSLGPHSMEAHADTRIAVEANAKSAAREFAASHLAGVDARITQETAAKAGAIMKLALEAKVDPSPPTGHSADIYGHSRQCYHHQEKYVAFLQELLCDIKRIPGFPRHSDGKVIVDTHPNFAPPWPKEIIGEKKCRRTHGNYASELQCGPIFNEDGEASCSTFEQMLQSLRWIDPRYSMRIIYYSDDILPSQVPFQDEHKNDFCTKINLLDKNTPEEKRKEYEYGAYHQMGYY